jgi:hypothetical protein
MAVLDGKPAIAYKSRETGDLTFIAATDANGSAWGEPITVDGVNYISAYQLVLVNSNDFPLIAYYDLTGNRLLCATYY